MAFSTKPSAGNNRLWATADNQTINALGGNDWLFSAFNASTLFGGNGHDRLSLLLDLPEVTASNAIRSANLHGGNGNDILDSVFRAQRIDDPDEPSFEISSVQSGGRGNDSIYITADGETEYYPSGHFEFDVDGGAGADSIWIEVSRSAVSNHNVVDAGSGSDNVYINFYTRGEFGGATNEVYAGTGDDDVFVSGAGSWASSVQNSVWGEEGNDRLEAQASGSAGYNRLFGGDGDDTLIATGYGAGDPGDYIANSAWGGAGNDTIQLNSTGRSLFSDATHTAYGDEGDDVIRSTIEVGTQETDESHSASAELYGGDGSDTLIASTVFSPDDEMRGGATLYGQAGNDILRVYGGVENTLSGGEGDDMITGGSGADRIIGAGGADRLRGGAGDDAFVFLWVAGGTPDIRDTIFDFGTGSRARGDDVIDVAGVDANADIRGNQTFAFGGTTQKDVGFLWVEEDPESNGSLVMGNNGGEQPLIIAVADGVGRDASDWRAEDFIL